MDTFRQMSAEGLVNVLQERELGHKIALETSEKLQSRYYNLYLEIMDDYVKLKRTKEKLERDLNRKDASFVEAVAVAVSRAKKPEGEPD